jgi:prepilin-type N-terminal cleavage/methylation domain-containing protein
MRRSRFTLIELLVVITIIAILMAILLPAVMAAYRETQKTKARAQMVTVKSAIQQYVDAYGSLPDLSSGINKDFVDAYLISAPAGSSNQNPRGIVLFANANIDKQLTLPWTLGAPGGTNGMKAVWNTATNKITVYASCPWSGSTFVSDGSTSLASTPSTP